MPPLENMFMRYDRKSGKIRGHGKGKGTLIVDSG